MNFSIDKLKVQYHNMGIRIRLRGEIRLEWVGPNVVDLKKTDLYI